MKGAWEGGSTACSPNQHEAWLADIGHWRNERRIRIGYDGSRYDLPALKWTQSSFFQPQMMMVEDRYFYDPVAHRYTVDRRDVPDRVCNGNLSRGTRTFTRQVNTDCYVEPAASTDPYWVNQAVLNFAEHRGNERRNNLVGLVLATGMCPSRKPSVFLAKDASFSSAESFSTFNHTQWSSISDGGSAASLQMTAWSIPKAPSDGSAVRVTDATCN